MRGKFCALFLLCLICPLTSFGAAETPGPTPGHYTVVTDQSLVRIQVFRDGILKRAGHNHVIGLRTLTGEVEVGETPEKTRLLLRFTATDLTVDLPDDRASGGEPFESPIDEQSRESTRENMLGARLLNAERYPQVRIRSRAIRGNFNQLTVDALVSLAGKENAIQVPVVLNYADDGILARGSVTLRHEQIGLVPFTVLLGALAVQDEMRIEFEILARPVADDDRVSRQ
jgi:hypothetical protein